MTGMNTVRRALAVILSLLLVTAWSPFLYGYQQEQEQEQAPAPQSAEQVQALVAPIALYPDALVAQILSAATFPDQVALAQNWMQEHKSLTGQDLMKKVNEQSWDPSVKALTAFPSVLDNMAKNLGWTSQLGEV